MEIDAALTPVPSSASRTTPISEGYTQTAAQDGISGIVGAGQTALAHRCRTLPGVSAPSSVVRLVIDTTRRMPCCFAVVLIERLPSVAARSSMPTRSTWEACGSPVPYGGSACLAIVAQSHVRPSSSSTPAASAPFPTPGLRGRRGLEHPGPSRRARWRPRAARARAARPRLDHPDPRGRARRRPRGPRPAPPARARQGVDHRPLGLMGVVPSTRCRPTRRASRPR